MKIAILGGGKWGITLAMVYSHFFKNIELWVRTKSKYKKETLACYLQQKRCIDAKFPRLKIKLPHSIHVSDNMPVVLNNANIILCTIPSAHIKEYTEEFKHARAQVFINASKGVIEDKPISAYFAKELPHLTYAILSGPNIAQQIIENFQHDTKLINPAFATLAYDPYKVKIPLIKHMNAAPYLKLSFHNNVTSVEYCSILKQIYAIALGFCLGLGLSGNTIAGLFHKSGEEITKIIKHLGYNPMVYHTTFAGAPDLEVSYKYGRNGKLGTYIAKHGWEKAKKHYGKECIEGIRVIKALYTKLNNKKLDVPIFKEVYSLMYEKKPLEQVKRDIINV